MGEFQDAVEETVGKGWARVIMVVAVFIVICIISALPLNAPRLNISRN